MEAQVVRIRRVVDERGQYRGIEGDGGIAPENVSGAVAAGANVIISGSSMFKDPEGLGHAVTELRRLAEAARSCGCDGPRPPCCPPRSPWAARGARPATPATSRRSALRPGTAPQRVVEGTSGAVRVDLGGSRI